ncbi:hypothetical protein EHP00_649 [Ecytonucleospora hepatopenaei]|nr:hypothetical protein EHP00_649 [Ecytonucleospora hepatopenaei]
MTENINIKDFLNARTKEINDIEKSMNHEKRVSQKFQELPHYARRRNHSYAPRPVKFKRRTKNRFLIRSHVYFAKRFKMLKLSLENDLDLKRSDISIPWERNIKSKSFLTKAYANGYFLDESFLSFQGFDLTEFGKEEKYVKNFEINEYFTLNGVDYLKNKQGYFKNVFSNKCFIQKHAIFKFFCLKEDILKDLKKIVRENNGILYKNKDKCALDNFLCILDVRNHIKTLLRFEKLFIRAVSIKELNILAIEQNKMTSYDLIHTEFFKKIDEKLYEDFVLKYNAKPLGKKNLISDLNIFKLSNTETQLVYAIFKLKKGSVKRSALVFYENEVVGRVIRQGYRFSSGCNYGLCCIFQNKFDRHFFQKEIKDCIFMCMDIDQKNKHPMCIMDILHN